MMVNQRCHFALSATFTLVLVALLSFAIPIDGQSNDGVLPRPADLAAQGGLPDSLVMLDGRRVTSRQMWIKKRRPELIRLFQHFMYGQLPQVEWLHPESGKYVPQPSVTVSGGDREFTPPFDPGHDWVLHLLKTDQP